jgi:hypothetical protein
MPSPAVRFTVWVALAGQLAMAAPTRAHGASPPLLPDRFERFLTDVVRPSATDRRRLHSGVAITKLLDGDPTKFVAVFGAIWIDATPRRYLQAAQDIEAFERGGSFRVTKRISAQPRLEDFAALRLGAEDVESLADCRPGECGLKLGASAIQAIQARVNFRAADAHRQAESAFRDQMLDLVRRYRAVGDAALPIYNDRPHPTNVVDEFRQMLMALPAVTAYQPHLRGFLLDYPRPLPSDERGFLYWQEVMFGLKPTLRISHLVVDDSRDETIVASKMLYASHYFLAALEVRVLAPDPARGPGFWFITISSTRVDGLSGFTGFFVRRRVRSETERGVQRMLTATKKKLEGT